MHPKPPGCIFFEDLQARLNGLRPFGDAGIGKDIAGADATEQNS